MDEATDISLDQSLEDSGKKKKGGMKLLIIIGIVLLLLGGGGVLAYTMLIKDKGEADSVEEAIEEEVKKTALVLLNPFVVNLSDDGRYLKVTMQFEVMDESFEEQVKEKTPNLRDIIITLLSSKSVASVSGVEGKFQLKDEILLRANQMMGSDVFSNIYFTDFVMQ